jgi:hypothetical protein
MYSGLIVHEESHKIVKYCKSLRGAKTSFSKKYSKLGGHVVMTPEEHQELDVEVEVRDLLSDYPVKIRRSQVGTCCDPSTETYHCM